MFRRGPILNGLLGLLFSRFSATGIGLAATVLLARNLSPTDFGLYAFALSVGTILALPLTGGLPTLVMREVAKGGARDNPALQRGVVRWGVVVLASVSLVALALALVVVFFVDQTPWWTISEAVKPLVVLVAFFVPVAAGIQLIRAVVSGHQKVALATLPEQVFRPAIFLAVLVIALPLIRLDAVSAFALQLGSWVAATVIAVVMALRLTRVKVRHVAPEVHSREWLFALLPLTALAATAVIKNHTDVFMLGIMRPIADVGIYRIAAQVALLSAIVMQLLRALAAPRIAAAYARDDRTEMQELFVSFGRIMFVASLAFIVLFVPFGRPALAFFFGPEYVDAYWPCLFLAAGNLFGSAAGLVGLALQVTRFAGLAARSSIISAGLNVVLNLALIPKYGASGAAAATAISMMSMEMQLWLLARRELGMRTDGFQRLGKWKQR